MHQQYKTASAFEIANKITNTVMDNASNMMKTSNDNFDVPGFDRDFGEDSHLNLDTATLTPYEHSTPRTVRNAETRVPPCLPRRRTQCLLAVLCLV